MEEGTPGPDRPIAAPQPTPVTGATSAPVTGLLIALAAIVAAALALGGLGIVGLVFMSRNAPSPVTALESEWMARVQDDYPGYRVDELQVSRVTVDEEPEMVAFATLSSEKYRGFTIATKYTASAAATGVAAFTSGDGFFSTPAADSQPVDSFISMWRRDHRDLVCTSVDDAGSGPGGIRRFDVGYEVTSDPSSTSVDDGSTYRYEYDPLTGAWSLAAQGSWDEQDAAMEESAAAGVADLPSYEDYVESKESIPVLVRKLLPGFDYRGAVDIGDGSGYALLRHKKYPGLRIVVDESSLQISPADDGALDILGGKTARGTAFARTWADRHPGTIIWVITIDPEYEADRNTVGVTYFDSLSALKAPAGVPEQALCRWDPSSSRWSVGK